MQNVTQSFIKKLSQPVSPLSLGLFRAVFGCILAFHVLEQIPSIHQNFIVPRFFFTYPFLELIKPWPDAGMYTHYLFLLICALGITCGIFYRLFLVSFLVAYSYTFLIDISYYKNHHYLMILITLLLIFIHADQKFTLPKPRIPKPCYYWNIAVLRFQFCVVYFFAGIAKLNYDWFHGEPLIYLLQKGLANRGSLWQTLSQQEWFIASFTTGGLLIDLMAPFLLLMRKTRMPTAIIVIIFHLINFNIFPNIKPFALVMLASLILFFDPDWPKIFRGISNFRRAPEIALDTILSVPAKPSALVKIGLAIYCLLQIALPLRHYFYEGDTLWTSRGERFTWRMVLQREKAEIMYYLTDPATKHTWEIDPVNDLSLRQFVVMRTRPEMVLQYAHYLRDRAQQTGIKNPEVRVHNTHSLNGRPYQLKIDPQTDLSKIGPWDNYMNWVLPFNRSF